LPASTAVDIQATKSRHKPHSLGEEFAERAAVSSLKIVCRNEEYSLTGEA
jgi:hypothetical protein